MQTTNNDYKLAAADLPGICSWVYFLGLCGSGARVVDGAARLFFLEILSLSEGFSTLKDPSFKWVISQMFSSLNSFPNNEEMSIVSQYMDYCNRTSVSLPSTDKHYVSGSIAGYPYVFTNYWITYLNGYAYCWGLWDDPDMYNRVIFQAGVRLPHPLVLQSRYNTIAKLMKDWNPNPPLDYIDVQPNTGGQANIQPATAAKTKLEAWAKINSMPSKVISSMEANKRLKMTDMIKSDSIYNADVYFFIFNWLVTLCAGNDADQKMALAIAKCPSSSFEYDNDTFINQLLYLALMHLGNPRGDFRFDNGGRQKVLTDLFAVIRGTDEATTIIKNSINNSLNRLRTNNSYPMQDTSNPDLGFNIRFTDTLAALEDGRRAVAAKL